MHSATCLFQTEKVYLLRSVAQRIDISHADKMHVTRCCQLGCPSRQRQAHQIYATLVGGIPCHAGTERRCWVSIMAGLSGSFTRVHMFVEQYPDGSITPNTQPISYRNIGACTCWHNCNLWVRAILVDMCTLILQHKSPPLTLRLAFRQSGT